MQFKTLYYLCYIYSVTSLYLNNCILLRGILCIFLGRGVPLDSKTLAFCNPILH